MRRSRELGLLVGSGLLPLFAAGDFRVSVSPPSQSVKLGQTATYSIGLVSTTFSGFVMLELRDRPLGVTTGTMLAGAGLIPNGAASGILEVRTSASTPYGSHTMTLYASGDGGVIRTAPVGLIIESPPLFTTTVDVTGGTVTQGEDAVFRIVVQTSSPLAGEISFAVFGLPPSVIFATFNPNPVGGFVNGRATTTLTVTTSRSTPVGTFPLTIRVSVTGQPAQEVTVNLTVNLVRDFTLSVQPDRRAVAQGQTATYTVTIQSQGSFASPVLLTRRFCSSREDFHAAIGVSCRTVDRRAVRMAVMVLRPEAVN